MGNGFTNETQIQTQFINSDIYVSFSTHDREFGSKLYQEMRVLGLRVFCDAFNMSDAKYKNTADNVAECDFFVAVMSKAYLKSPICKDELMFAFTLKKNIILIFEGGVAPSFPLALKLALLPSYDTTDYKSVRALVYDIFADGDMTAEKEAELHPKKANGQKAPARPSYEETLKLDSGDTYIGEAANGIPEGRGRLNYARGGYYEGEFSGGLPNGHGIVKYADGDSYEGDFRRGVPEGVGTYRFKGGNVYTGDMKRGIFSGRGSMYFADGNTYHGEFLHDMINGHGIFRLADGSVYEGEFADGNYNGHGKFSFFSGDEYEGEFADGKFHGCGKYTTAKGDMYRGEFADDKRHGKGILYKGGVKYGVEYKNGRLISKTKMEKQA